MTSRLRLVLVPSHPVLLKVLLAHEVAQSLNVQQSRGPVPAAHLFDLAILGGSQDRLPLRIVQATCFCSKDLTDTLCK